jgi:hypothetical protein
MREIEPRCRSIVFSWHRLFDCVGRTAAALDAPTAMIVHLPDPGVAIRIIKATYMRA